jgi:hypothetical protein
LEELQALEVSLLKIMQQEQAVKFEENSMIKFKKVL